MRWLLLALLLVTGACDQTREVVDFRPSCEVCHRPRPGPGRAPAGIDDAHPWAPLSCVACHGGNADVYDQSRAHVTAIQGPRDIRNLTPAELDVVDPAWLRFVNPGDLRVADTTCGAEGCHGEIVERVRRSSMAHTAGEVTVARYRAGAQDEPIAQMGPVALTDPDFDRAPAGAARSLEQFDPPVEDPLAAGYAAVQDDYLVKSCFRCHVWDFGENKFPGDYRSSGCTACHMPYADDGVSQSADPALDPQAIPRPIRHQLTSAIPTEQCMHCHYRGARIGPSFLGYRERAGAGFNPPNPDTLGKALHGHDAGYYLTDEDVESPGDETPPDVHAEAGMHCVDCHTEVDVHGDGHLYGDTVLAVEVRCESCHGTIDAETDGRTAAGRPMANLSRDASGQWVQKSKMEDRVWAVPQVAHSVDPSHPEYSPAADRAMGRDASGFSHADEIRCDTCHAAWLPSCYGCHVTMDYSAEGRIQSTGRRTPGRPSGTRKWVVLDDMVLMRDPFGRIGLSMPAERFFLSAIDASGEVAFEGVARTRPDGSSGFGQRVVQPHTIRRSSRFSRCDRCHIRADGANEAQVRVAVGLGSDRFIEVGPDGQMWRLDAIQTEDGAPLVTVGHPYPGESRPLEVDLMRRLLETPLEAP